MAVVTLFAMALSLIASLANAELPVTVVKAVAASNANEAKRVEAVALVAATPATIEKSAADIAAAENAIVAAIAAAEKASNRLSKPKHVDWLAWIKA